MTVDATGSCCAAGVGSEPRRPARRITFGVTLDVGANERAELRGRVQDRFVAQFVEALLHVGRLQRLAQRAGKLRDDVGRSARRRRTIPYQASTRKSRNALLGDRRNLGQRQPRVFAPATARMRSVPAFACGASSERSVTTTSISPLKSASTACAVTRYGTWTMFTPVADLIHSTARLDVLPMPLEPLVEPAWMRSARTSRSSANVVAGTPARTASAYGTTATPPIGAEIPHGVVARSPVRATAIERLLDPPRSSV